MFNDDFVCESTKHGDPANRLAIPGSSLDMTRKHTIPIEYLTHSVQLRTLTEHLTNEDMVAVDSESNSRHRYPERVCLIQVAVRSKVYLIDTLEVRDMAPLGEILSDPSIRKVIHGADYDLRCFDRQWGFRVQNLFDTTIAAQFIGLRRFALPTLTKELLGVEIEKNERLQRSDWTLRPLGTNSLEYAAQDVWYLEEIQKILEEKLTALGRTKWVAEEHSRLEQVRHVARKPEIAFLSVKGSQTLNGRQLAVLKSLFIFRESEARRMERPPYYVLPDDNLVHLAVNPEADLAQLPSVRRRVATPFGRALRESLARGVAAPEVERSTPDRSPQMTPSSKALLDRLKKWRQDWGEQLDIDPSLIWPMASLNRLARVPEHLATELDSPQVRQWQKTEFADSLPPVLEEVG